MSGVLDVQVLRAALQRLVTRHELLRTGFAGHDAKPRLQIVAQAEIPLIVSAEVTAPGCTADEIVSTFTRREIQVPFQLDRAPLVRVTLIPLGEREHALLLVVHHLIFDGWSAGVLIRDLLAEYASIAEGRPALPPLPFQYADYSAWQRERQTEGAWNQTLEEVTSRLESAPKLALPHDYSTPSEQSYTRGRVTRRISTVSVEQVRSFAREQGTTPFTVLCGVFGLCIARFSGKTDFVIGTPIANRGLPHATELVGPFFNHVPIRFRASAEASLIGVVSELRQETAAAFALEPIPIELIAQAVNRTRRTSAPLYLVMFALQNFPIGPAQAAGLQVSGFALDSDAVQFGATAQELDLAIMETGDHYTAYLGYDPALFRRETVEALAESFETLLAEGLAAPRANAWDLPILSSRQLGGVLHRAQAPTQASGPCDLVSLHSASSYRHAERVAIRAGGSTWNYQSLHASANRVARLLQKRGIGPEDRVAICLPREPGFLLTMLAVLKAGACYVPVDPRAPAERISYILSNARCRLVIHEDTLAQLLEESRKLDSTELPERPHPDQLAYLIYTSGSTGRPKGVAISHRAAANHMKWMQRVFPLAAEDVCLQRSPLTFDASVWECHVPLIAGATLVLAAPEADRDPNALAAQIEQDRITVLQLVPGLLNALLAQPAFARATGLRRVFCGGERLSHSLVNRFREHSGAELVNLYGPTEATIDATAWVCSADDEPVPIGRPIDNLQAYVLDRRLHPAPFGAHGELYLSGVGLARGYCQNARLTASAFLPDPLAAEPGSRMYATGDRARWHHDGRLEWLGRRDRQVKVRGFRIELAEVEAAIVEQPGVHECAVLVNRLSELDSQLIAVVVPREGASLDTNQLRDTLGQTLPSYMVPTRFVVTAGLPRSAHGKRDMEALELIARALPPSAHVFAAPATVSEVGIAAIVAHALRLERVGIDDNFFELGCTSLTLVSVHEEIERRWPGRVLVADLFRFPTTRLLASRVDGTTAAASPNAEARQRGARRRATAAARAGRRA